MTDHRGQLIRLVAVVIDDGALLLTRSHDADIWRLPTAVWATGTNPANTVRELIAAISGQVVSPRLHSSVKTPAAVAGAALVFTATPLVPASVRASRPARWLPLAHARAALRLVDAEILALTQRPPSRGRRAGHLSSVASVGHAARR